MKVKEIVVKLTFLHSLRARIFFIIVLAGVIPTFWIHYMILNNFEDESIESRNQTIETQLKIIADHLITYNYLRDSSSAVINAELEILANIYDGRVLVIDHNLNVIKDTYGISDGKTIIQERVIRCMLGESLTTYNQELEYVEFTTPIANITIDENQNTTSEIIGVLLTTVSTESVTKTKTDLSRNANIIELILVVAILLLGSIVSEGLIKPFNRITEAINAVKKGYSDEIISVPDYLETEHIAEAFNQLQSRMKVLDESRQEFVANVSHELKTPLTSMKVLADSLLMDDNADLEMHREFLQDIASEIDRENEIINDLLALVKMDKTASELNIKKTNMNELIELILKRLRPIARKMDVEVVFESEKEVEAEIDEVKITLVISNLVENAIKYNKIHGWVRVILDGDHQEFTVMIMDSGIGIAEDNIEFIYERFYRVDKSHSKEIGGTGLGLAITKNAIQMHKGSITVSSIEGDGSTFIVTIPNTYI